jgi:D-tyrosyl-tRNA(Tyr) deacylase
MKAVIQRMMSASVRVEGRAVENIVDGLLVFPGVANGDGESDDRFLIEKIRTLRIFPDERGKMNRSLLISRQRRIGLAGVPVHAPRTDG